MPYESMILGIHTSIPMLAPGTSLGAPIPLSPQTPKLLTNLGVGIAPEIGESGEPVLVRWIAMH